MDFFDKLGKKASEAYKVTADKTGKIAKETKLKFKMSELKSKVEDIYEEIGKKVYETHVKKENISMEDLLPECKQIDELSEQIENIRKECLELKDKKQCSKCFKEIDKEMKFCPECGAKQEEQEAREVEVLENKEQNSMPEDNKNEESAEGQTNLEKTTVIEINPDAQNITEEEINNIGK